MEGPSQQPWQMLSKLCNSTQYPQTPDWLLRPITLTQFFSWIFFIEFFSGIFFMDFFCFPSCATLLNILKPQAGCCCVPPITLAQTFPGSTEDISFDFEKAFSLSEQFRIGFSWIFGCLRCLPLSPILNSLFSFLTR